MKSPRLLVLLASLFFSLSITAQKKGDVNGDQSVDISDVVAAINTIAGDNTYKSTADVNKDGKTDISDVVAIINIIANGAKEHEKTIRLSELTKIIFNGNVMQVFYEDKSTDYTIEKGLELSLNELGPDADNKFLDFYLNGKIVTSLAFKDADKLAFEENGLLDFYFDDKIIHQTLTSKVDSIVVYDRLKEPLSYLGVIAFNQKLYEKPIGVIDNNTVNSYQSFVSSLTTQRGTILYYAADNALDRLTNYRFDTPLNSVYLITFTDGLDQGSHNLNDTYKTNENYLNHLSSLISTTKVAGLPLNAYSIGLKGSDVTDEDQFKANLRALASSDDKAIGVNNVSALETRLTNIANSIVSRIITKTTTTTGKLSFTIPITEKGTKVRIVLDGKAAETSSLYIQGTFLIADKALHNVILKGITSGGASSFDVLEGTVDGMFVTYSLSEIAPVAYSSSNDFTISKNNVRQYNMSPSSTIWQINSEFNPESDVVAETKTETKTTYYGTAILLLLDCSSSLSSDFSKMKDYANNFITKIAANAKKETTARPFGYNDPNKHDPAVKAGLCSDNNHPHVIDLGTAGKWSCCNVGASAPWKYGGYYAWGETEEKSIYSESSYKYYSNNKYQYLGSDIAGTDYDVAHVKWGGKWSMPSFEQIELLNNCTSKWITVNGINGRKYTASNGNAIFLPAAGYRWDDDTSSVGHYGYYWSSTPGSVNSNYAYGLSFYSGSAGWGHDRRSYGWGVRPVTE